MKSQKERKAGKEQPHPAHEDAPFKHNRFHWKNEIPQAISTVYAGYAGQEVSCLPRTQQRRTISPFAIKQIPQDTRDKHAAKED